MDKPWWWIFNPWKFVLAQDKQYKTDGLEIAYLKTLNQSLVDELERNGIIVIDGLNKKFDHKLYGSAVWYVKSDG